MCQIFLNIFDQGCGSAAIVCGSGGRSWSECGSGFRSGSSLTKCEEKKHYKYEVVKNLKDCSKKGNNAVCANLHLKKLQSLKLQSLAISLHIFVFDWHIYLPGSAYNECRSTALFFFLFLSNTYGPDGRAVDPHSFNADPDQVIYF